MKRREKLLTAQIVLSAVLFCGAALFLYTFRWAEHNRDLGLWYYLSKGSIRQYAALCYHCIPVAIFLIFAAGAAFLLLRGRLTGKGRRIAAHILTLSAVLLTAAAACAAYPRMREERAILRLRGEIAREGCIMHAAGGIMDASGTLFSYTNSSQALHATVAAGRRFIELDMALTTDGVPVMTHEWENLTIDGRKIEGPVSAEEFSRAKVAGVFDTMTLQDVLAVMREHPELTIVTDARGDTQAICEAIMRERDGRELAERFIVQIYHEAQYEEVYGAGFRRIIYTLYDAEPQELSIDRLRAMTRRCNLTGLTFWEDWTENPSFYDNGVTSFGVPLYVHTVNDRERMAQLKERGITAFYTDLVN
ncbi:MAG: hypothetical protein J6I56_04045 [Lachnospiraceae bacterium]|nr:hypothetical protein [Lachnospiraceae bacterium]